MLLFIDADVVVHPDVVARIRQAFEEEPSLAAVFGSYDANPRAPGIVSRYRNLLHHFVHQRGHREAATFWAGLGAVPTHHLPGSGGIRRCSIPQGD